MSYAECLRGVAQRVGTMKELEVKCVDLSRFEWNPNRQLAYRAAVKAQDKVVEAA
jgi:hypothetical protein